VTLIERRITRLYADVYDTLVSKSGPQPDALDKAVYKMNTIAKLLCRCPDGVKDTDFWRSMRREYNSRSKKMSDLFGKLGYDYRPLPVENPRPKK